MQYLVLGSDGNEYGPVDLQTLKAWLQEGRIDSTTQVTDALSNQTLTVSQMPDLGVMSNTSSYSQAPSPPQSYTQYPREGDQPLSAARRPTRFWGILVWFGIATVISFFYNWWPLWITGFNVFDALRARAYKDPKTDWCLFVGIGGFGAMILWSIFKARIGAW